jgi:glutamate-ammonia-ligase adenylyltransferase
MPRRTSILALARSIDPLRAEAYAGRLAGALPPGSEASEIGILLATAYPAIGPLIEAAPGLIKQIAAEGYHAPRSRAEQLSRLRARLPDVSDTAAVIRELRVTAKRERMRIALREALPAWLGGADVDVTARELSALAEATIEIALEEAKLALSRRFGRPLTSRGDPARFVVLGMGKLGGDELNPGSDVDLLYFYDTDEGATRGEGGEGIALFDFWTRVAKRLTASLEEVTEDGFVWRVDLRLRPEGRSGPLVNSLAAAERYYEAFGRLWERAALLRARPVAGDRGFGDEVLGVLSPFVWRRRVDPSIAVEMAKLAERARAELAADPARDVKLGPGGIREAEFFVQSLELIWGGREPRVRAKGTLDGLRRLRAAGFVTDREGRQIANGYLALRRAEHAVQAATGLQTHAIPRDAADARRIARLLGYADLEAFLEELARQMGAIAGLFASLAPDGAPVRSRFTEAIAALERGKLEAFTEAILRAVMRPSGSAGVSTEAAPIPEAEPITGPDAADRWRDLARDLFELARHPDAPLGARSRELFPSLAEVLLEAVIDAADPEQAARYLRIFFGRLRHPGVYVHLLGDDPNALRRLVTAVGASAFIADALIGNPELGDVVLFWRRSSRRGGVKDATPLSPGEARAEIEVAVGKVMGAADPEDELVEALRRTKARVTIEVGLADLEGALGPREGGAVLSALADASLEAATRFALDVPEGAPVKGLSVIAMGTLGGREIGYGSDLDVIFLFDPEAAPPGADPGEFFTKRARRIIRLISASHPAGPGYELDTRLRPSGSQGLLVTSIEAFARYHGVRASVLGGGGSSSSGAAVSPRAAAWERLALLRARACAGDPGLGAEAIRIVEAAAYEGLGGDPAELGAFAREIHRLRMRMERELSQERGGRFDPKLGRGGIADVEMCVELLQVKHGRDPAVRTTETQAAIEALADRGYLSAEPAAALGEGYAFLRKLQWRIRILHATASQLIEEGAPGLVPLAHRMGIRSRPGHPGVGATLCAHYKATTDRIRDAYEQIVVGAG